MLRSTNHAALFSFVYVGTNKIPSGFPNHLQAVNVACSFVFVYLCRNSGKYTNVPKHRTNKQPFSRLAVRLVRSCTFVCLKYPMYESINTSFPHVRPSHKGKPDISEVVPFGLSPVRTFQTFNAWLVCFPFAVRLVPVWACTGFWSWFIFAPRI